MKMLKSMVIGIFGLCLFSGALEASNVDFSQYKLEYIAEKGICEGLSMKDEANIPYLQKNKFVHINEMSISFGTRAEVLYFKVVDGKPTEEVEKSKTRIFYKNQYDCGRDRYRYR